MNSALEFHLPQRALFPTTEIDVLVCLVQWDDHEGRIIPDPNHFRELWNGETFGTVSNPGESISQWLYSNSYGDYSVRAHVVDWQHLNQTEAYWANGNMGHSNATRTIGEAFVPILKEVAQSGIDLSKYDYDNDRSLDSIVSQARIVDACNWPQPTGSNSSTSKVFVHSGFAAELGGVDCFTGANHTDRIMSDTWDADIKIGSTGLKLGSFVTVSAFDNLCDLGPAHIGNHLQQWLRSHFGLSDTFDLGGRYQETSTAVGGLGGYDIMSFAGGQEGLTQFPGILSPYGKMELGSLDPIEIIEDGVYTARASALFPDVYKISSPYPSGEYLLIENRQPLLSDLYLWQPGGIVIYHVDENTGGNGNRERGGPFSEGWPGNGAHYKVALLQADGKYELEQGLNQGHIDDFWKVGDVLGPGNGETEATSNGTYPNTDSYMGGNILVNGLQLDHFQEIESGVWSFRVSNLVALAQDHPPPSQAPTSELNIFQTPRSGQVNCYGPILNDPSFFCDCTDDCTARNNFVCGCAEAQACCSAFIGSLDSTDSPAPSSNPSNDPTKMPSQQPSVQPSKVPTLAPSGNPSGSLTPSSGPSVSPSGVPSVIPSAMPSSPPSFLPSESMMPSTFPTVIPPMTNNNVSSIGAGFVVVIVLAILLLMILYILMLMKRLKEEENNDPTPEERDGIMRPLEQLGDDDGVSTLTPSLVSSIPSITSHLARMREQWGYNGSNGSIDYEPPPVPPRKDSAHFSHASSLENYGWSV